MINSDFDAFVKRQQSEPEGDVTFNPKRRLTEWLDHLDALYKQIAEYLQTYIESGAAHIVHRDISRNEELAPRCLAWVRGWNAAREAQA